MASAVPRSWFAIWFANVSRAHVCLVHEQMVQKSHVQKLSGSHKYFQVAIERDLQLI
jgi:hypothetical protein